MQPTRAHTTIMKRLLAEGRPINEIRAVYFFKKLSDEDFNNVYMELQHQGQVINEIKEIVNTPEPETINPKRKSRFKSFRLTPQELIRIDSFINYVGTSDIGDHVNYLKGNGKQSQVIRLALDKFLDKYFPQSRE